MAPARNTEQTPFKLHGLGSYPGGKAGDGTVQRLINAIPPHTSYVEPFLGGGAVMRHKRPAATLNMGIEVNPQLASLWRDQAPRWLKVKQGDGLAYMETLASGPVDATGVTEGLFLFVDPPYLDETLKTGRAPYADRFTYDDHVRLHLALQRITSTTKAMVMLCALPNLLTETQLKGWRTFQYENKTRRGMQTEQVWMNYAQPTALHDDRYIGNDYRNREAVKRAVKAIQRFIDMHPRKKTPRPPLERLAIINALKRANP